MSSIGPNIPIVKYQNFRPWVQKVMPGVYDDTLSYYELLAKVVAYLNQMNDQQNEIIDWLETVVGEQNKDIEMLKKAYITFRGDMVRAFEEFTKKITDQQTQFEKDITDKVLGVKVGEILQEWFDNGKLAEIINKDVFDMKVDKATFEPFKNSVDTYIKNNKMVVINVQDYGAKGDGDKDEDDTVAVRKAISENPNSIIFFPKTNDFYLITGDIDVPKGTQILSNGATIQFRGSALNLKGDNNVQGIVFDGNWSTKGIKVLGNNTKILHNTIKNIKANAPGETNAINYEGVKEGLVFGNTFDGIQPYIESGNGDQNGISRCLRINKSHNIVVDTNVFKNMKGFQDSDYVFVHTDQQSTNTFPYQAQNGWVFDRVDGVVIINNQFYSSLNKSAVKVQASGVVVTDNDFITDYNAQGGTMFSVFRTHNNYGTVCKRNKFFNKGSKMTYQIYLEYCEDVTFSDNEIFFDKPITYELDSTSRTLFVLSCKNAEIKNNFIEGYNNKEAVRIDSCKHVDFSDNTFKYKHVDLTGNHYVFNISNGQIKIVNDKITLRNNRFYSDSDKKMDLTIQNTNNLFIDGNTFIGCIFGNFSIGGVNNTVIQRNTFDVTSGYFINVLTGTNGLRVVKNKMGAGITRFINISNPAVKVSAIDNDFDVEPTQGIFTLPVDQDLNEVEYKKGNVSLRNYDYGFETQRNKVMKPIGFPFYDMTLKKMIYWNGTAWIDASGTVIA